MAIFQRLPDDNNIEDSKSFKSKIKITGKTPNNNSVKDVEIIVPLKYLSYGMVSLFFYCKFNIRMPLV